MDLGSLSKAGRRLVEGWSKAGRRLVEGWSKACRRLVEGLSKAGQSVWKNLSPTLVFMLITSLQLLEVLCEAFLSIPLFSSSSVLFSFPRGGTPKQ